MDAAGPPRYPAGVKRRCNPAAAPARADQDLLACRLCPRLVAHREAIAARPRRAHAGQPYWGLPVPGCGDPAAPLVLIGLAPGAHGSNRTGRMFTGDASGDFLYPALHRLGFASRPDARGRDDGLALRDVFITAAVRCAPPGNRPAPAELAACRRWLARDLAALPRARVLLALGRIAHQAVLDLWRAEGAAVIKSAAPFAHGAEHRLPPLPAAGTAPLLLDSYHVSRQNTYTGRLTAPMFDAVLARGRALAGLPPAPPPSPPAP